MEKRHLGGELQRVIDDLEKDALKRGPLLGESSSTIIYTILLYMRYLKSRDERTTRGAVARHVTINKCQMQEGYIGRCNKRRAIAGRRRILDYKWQCEKYWPVRAQPRCPPYKGGPGEEYSESGQTG